MRRSNKRPDQNSNRKGQMTRSVVSAGVLVSNRPLTGSLGRKGMMNLLIYFLAGVGARALIGYAIDGVRVFLEWRRAA